MMNAIPATLASGAAAPMSARLLVLLLVLAAAPRAAAADPLDPPAGFDEAALAQMTHLSFDQPAPPPDAPPAAAPILGGFSKETWCGNFYGSAIFGDPGKGEMYLAHGGFGYYFEDYQSVNVDFFGGYVRSGIDDNGVAGGFDVLYRAHFSRSEGDERTIYFQAGAGLQQASTNFSGRRHFNFRLLIGFGATFEINDRARLMLGASYIHISDAGMEGGGGGFDGPMVYAGITLPF